VVVVVVVVSVDMHLLPLLVNHNIQPEAHTMTPSRHTTSNIARGKDFRNLSICTAGMRNSAPSNCCADRCAQEASKHSSKQATNNKKQTRPTNKGKEKQTNAQRH
jgi:hypothetical protein